MPDLTDADLEAMEKRCEKELEGPWPHVIYPAHARSDVPALIAALRDARGKRDVMSELYAREGHKSLVLLNENTSLLAENRLLREWLNKATTKLCRLNIAWTWPSPDIASLTAAEAERVRRMESLLTEALSIIEIDLGNIENILGRGRAALGEGES